tara:strand:- start:247347 stop:248384 length:1038 start_codon:yes stop_codon:yes gene_type:complete
MSRAFVLVAIAGTVLLSTGCTSSGSSSSTPPQTRAAPVQQFVAGREPWSYQGNAGWIYYTPSSTIRTTITDRQMLIRIPSFVELSQIHARTALTVLPEPSEPVDTYFLGSRRQWETMTKKVLKDRAPVYLAIERGGFSVGTTGVYYDLGPRDSFAIAAHEGWHQYAHAVMIDRLPVWLDEGIACYLEGFRWDEVEPDTPKFLPWANLERYDQLRKAHANGSLMSLHTLVSNRPQDLMSTDQGGDRALTYYAQHWALVHFFREFEGGRYSTGLARTLQLTVRGELLDNLSETDARTMRTRRSGPGVLSIIAPGVSLRELDEQYQVFISRIVRPGGRNAALSGQSPI